MVEDSTVNYWEVRTWNFKFATWDWTIIFPKEIQQRCVWPMSKSRLNIVSDSASVKQRNAYIMLFLFHYQAWQIQHVSDDVVYSKWILYLSYHIDRYDWIEWFSSKYANTCLVDSHCWKFHASGYPVLKATLFTSKCHLYFSAQHLILHHWLSGTQINLHLSSNLVKFL